MLGELIQGLRDWEIRIILGFASSFGESLGIKERMP
jgi:hypothetical protein